MTLIRWTNVLAVVVSLSACATPAQPTLTPAPPTVTDTIVPPSATSTPTATAALAPSETPAPTPTATPAPAYSQAFTATVTAGALWGGEIGALSDGNPDNWVSLRNGRGYEIWTLDLQAPAFISGVKFWAVADAGDLPLLLPLEVSEDGQQWATTPLDGPNCSAAGCELPPNGWSEFHFPPVHGRYVRISSGPRWMAFAEIAVEVQPAP